MPPMSRRMRVLLSAFACEPYKGSEPEVGWQWAVQIARFHDVTVLTQSKNKANIERALKALDGRQPEPQFIYYDLPKLVQNLRRTPIGLRIYYVLWQKWARAVVKREHRKKPFDLLHHITFAAFRYPTIIWGHGVPCIWGPVGGIESIPTPLLPWGHPVSLIEEVLRNISNVIQTSPYNDLPKRAADSDCVLVSTSEMQETLAKLDFPSRLMPTIGLQPRDLPYQSHRPSEGPLRILFVGKIITLKGVDLALEALNTSGTDATLTLVGTGNYLPASRRLTEKLNLGKRVTFQGQMTREQVLALYPQFDVLLFPSLHDTGGYAVIEAMFNELPVICLDCGGPAVAVQDGCGVKVPVGPRRDVIAGLAAAICRYDRDRKTLLAHGKAARESILEHYDWDKKGVQMNEVYEETMAQVAEQTPEAQKHLRSHRAPGTPRGVFSFRGSAVATAILFLVGLLGFISLAHLKKEVDLIVNDTLPGLSYAGEANAYIADASRTLLFITLKDPESRKKLQAEIDAFGTRTTKYLALYQSQIYEDEDRTNFQTLIRTREEYVNVRDHVLSLANAGKETEALAVYNDSLMPVHSRVKKAADKLFEYNMHQGQFRGRRIMAFCTTTQVLIGVSGVLIFAIGFFIGLFK